MHLRFLCRACLRLLTCSRASIQPYLIFRVESGRWGCACCARIAKRCCRPSRPRRFALLVLLQGFKMTSTQIVKSVKAVLSSFSRPPTGFVRVPFDVLKRFKTNHCLEMFQN